jgi:hypothetical protein
MKRLSVVFLALAACVAGDLGDPDKGGEEDALPADGKLDSFRSPIDHGALTWGVPGTSKLASTAKFHAWDFTLYGGADVELVTGPQTSNGHTVDTVLYLYREGASGWGSYIARNDDHDDTLWSRLIRNLGAGHYRVLVKGYSASTTGKFAVTGTCTGGGCAPAAAECLLGTTYGEWRDSPDYDTLRQVKLTAASQLEGLEPDQIVVALHASSHTDVTTVAEAFERVDGGEINVTERQHRATGQITVAFEYGAGDNSYGAIFYVSTVEEAALIHDGDLLDCTFLPPAGSSPLGEDCRATSDCPAGVRCQGITAGIGVCVDLTDVAGEGTQCGSDEQCPGSLICAGMTRDFGLCAPAWTRGTFDAIPGAAIPDGGELRTYLTAYGLATVDTDVTVRATITHAHPNQLRIYLRNPAASDVLVWDGPASSPVEGTSFPLDMTVLGFSGDESVNGSWTLRVVDTVPGGTGTVVRWGLTLGSRWD